MKKLIAGLAVVVFTLAFGIALADELPAFTDRKDVGTELYNDAFAPKDQALGASEVRGAGAGGVSTIDEKTLIWNALMGPDGGSDLP